MWMLEEVDMCIISVHPTEIRITVSLISNSFVLVATDTNILKAPE